MLFSHWRYGLNGILQHLVQTDALRLKLDDAGLKLVDIKKIFNQSAQVRAIALAHVDQRLAHFGHILCKTHFDGIERTRHHRQWCSQLMADHCYKISLLLLKTLFLGDINADGYMLLYCTIFIEHRVRFHLNPERAPCCVHQHQLSRIRASLLDRFLHSGQRSWRRFCAEDAFGVVLTGNLRQAVTGKVLKARVTPENLALSIGCHHE